MGMMTMLHPPPSSPRRRVSSTPRHFGSITSSSEYWIIRRSLSSGAHSRDPVADDDEQRHSRDSIRPRFANSSAPEKKEGAGKTGCALHPRSHVQMCIKKCAHEHTGSAEAVRPSLRNGLTTYTCSPWWPCCATIIGVMRKHHRPLDASTGASGPHDFAVRAMSPAW